MPKIQEDKIEGDKLFDAIRKGNLKTADLEGVNVNTKETGTGVSLLQLAVGRGNKQIVTALLERGANVNSLDKTYGSPLADAISNGHADIAVQLLQKGADLNAETTKGKTTLSFAVSCAIQNPELGDPVLSAILENAEKRNLKEAIKGLNPTTTNTLIEKTKKEVTFFLGEAYVPKKYELAQKIIQAFPRNYQNHFRGVVREALTQGLTSEQLIYSNQGLFHEREVFEAIFRKCNHLAPPEMQEADNLLDAIKKEELYNMNYFLKQGADVNIADKDGVTPLSYAIKEGYEDLTSTLLERGADVNIADKDGITPLLYAIKEGYQDLTSTLLKQGADLNIADKDGVTPLSYATQDDYEEILWSILKNAQKQDFRRAITDLDENSKVILIDKTKQAVSVLLNNNKPETDELALKFMRKFPEQDRKAFKEIIATNASQDVNRLANLNKVFDSTTTGEVLSKKLFDTDLNSPKRTITKEELFAKIRNSTITTNDLDGINVNAQEEKTKLSLLQLAAGRGNKQIVTALLERGANVNSLDDSKGSPLVDAISNGHVEIAVQLLQKGADLLQGETLSHETCLSSAVNSTDPSILGKIFLYAEKENLRKAIEGLNPTTKDTLISKINAGVEQLLDTKDPTLQKFAKEMIRTFPTEDRKNFREFIDAIQNNDVKKDLLEVFTEKTLVGKFNASLASFLSKDDNVADVEAALERAAKQHVAATNIQAATERVAETEKNIDQTNNPTPTNSSYFGSKALNYLSSLASRVASYVRGVASYFSRGGGPSGQNNVNPPPSTSADNKRSRDSSDVTSTTGASISSAANQVFDKIRAQSFSAPTANTSTKTPIAVGGVIYNNKTPKFDRTRSKS